MAIELNELALVQHDPKPLIKVVTLDSAIPTGDSCCCVCVYCWDCGEVEPVGKLECGSFTYGY